ncbi:MAG: putative peptidoglycan glycosyltransferase FtsW [bacterium]|nr:putative peptidoglycan glycosyltransferase FtsW [bacterium]
MNSFLKPAGKVDKPFLFITSALVLFGFFIFLSASFGILTRENGPSLSQIIFNQFLFGLIFGSIAAFISSRVPYRLWRKYSFYFLLFGILLTLLVFVPRLGFSHGGATRWLSLGPISLQPAEILKLAFVVYFASWLSGVYREIGSFKYGLLPFCGLIAVVGAVLLSQPDTGTFVSIFVTAVTMFVLAGGKIRDILIIALIGILSLTFLAWSRPYVMTRITTFLNPENDPRGSSYQIQQSLIAIGSGGLWGRGFGQSVQKFNYLPEPIGDSIFAVAAEEFGFIGGLFLIALFTAFGLRGFYIARHAPDVFGGLLVSGITTLIIVGSFMNIGSMLAVFPLSGQPLLFVSHGGTALLIALFSTGIVLNISRYAKKPTANN